MQPGCLRPAYPHVCTEGINISLAMVFGGWHEVNTPPDLTRLGNKTAVFGLCVDQSYSQSQCSWHRFVGRAWLSWCRAWNDTALFLSEEDTVTQVKAPYRAGALSAARGSNLSGYGCLPSE